MAMDQSLAAYYGTNQEQADDTGDMEKLAQLTLLDAYATEHGVDLSHLSQDEALNLAGQVIQEQEKLAAAGAGGLEKNAEENFNEFEYGGKVFAHSFVNELNEIQKEAGARTDAAREMLSRFGQGAKGLAGRASEGAKGLATGAGKGTGILRTEAHKGARADVVREGTSAALGSASQLADAKKLLKMEQLKRLGRGAATATGAGALTGGGIYAGTRKKESAAIDQLANARAYEILQEQGLADAQGNVVPPEYFHEKTAADQLNEAVDAQAWAILESAGYPIIDG